VNTLGRKKPRFGCPGQVNFALGQVKMEVWWASGQVGKWASVQNLPQSVF